MIDNQDLSAVAALEEAAVAKNNSNIVAFAVGGAMLAIGAGLGFVFGSKKGVKTGMKKGEDAAKAAMSSEINGLNEKIAQMEGAK